MSASDDIVSQQRLSRGYLGGLPSETQELLCRVNGPGLTLLRQVLATGDAIAFLGAGSSVPLYPSWDELIAMMIDHAAERMPPDTLRTCREQASGNPDAVVEILRGILDPPDYRELLRLCFRQRRDPASGKSFTPVQELVARSHYAGVVTTNYDPGILNARMSVRPDASATGFAVWVDDELLDRWRTGDIFADEDLPVLYAHGQHNRPDTLVLATTEYHLAYAGKLKNVLTALFDRGHFVWIGFSFRDTSRNLKWIGATTAAWPVASACRLAAMEHRQRCSD